MQNTRDSWDLFFSHASEDKEDLVLPLARLLIDIGVSVWLDARELKAGDSLSKSVDQGLLYSRFAVVVLSPAFLSKKWPEYEYRGLLTKELAAEGKIILPLWHNVTHADVLRYSPPLADKFAITSAGTTLNELASKIIAIVRPDLDDALHRRVQQLTEQAATTMPLSIEELPQRTRSELEDVPVDRIRMGSIKHHRLSNSIIQRVRLIRAALLDVYPQTMEFWVDGFRRDPNIEREVEIWERLASAYLEIKALPDFSESAERHKAFTLLTRLSWSGTIVPTDEFPVRLVETVKAHWDIAFPEGGDLEREEEQAPEISTNALNRKLDGILDRLEWDATDSKQLRYLQYLRAQAKNAVHNIIGFSELLENKLLSEIPRLGNTKNSGSLRFYVILCTAGIVLEALKESTKGKVRETLLFVTAGGISDLGGDYENGLKVLQRFVEHVTSEGSSLGLQEWAELAGLWMMINLTEDQASEWNVHAGSQAGLVLFQYFGGYWLLKSGM